MRRAADIHRGITDGIQLTFSPFRCAVTLNLLATSKLGEAGGLGSFPSQTILAYNASKQEKAFVPVNSPAPANSPTPANMNLTAQAAQTVRSTTSPRELKPGLPAQSAIVILPRSLQPRELKPRLPAQLPIVILPRSRQPRPPPPARRRTQPPMELAGTAGTTRILGILRIVAIAGTAGTTRISGILRIAAIAATAGTIRISGISRIEAIAGMRRGERADSCGFAEGLVMQILCGLL
jgi:hypothetical protein